MSSLEALYQQVILDHARERHGHGLDLGQVAGPGAHATDGGGLAASSRQYNPLCGDEVTVRLEVRDGATGQEVVGLSWAGDGCSISQAATSVLHDLVLGRPVEQARSILGDYRVMLRSRGEAAPDEQVLGDAVAFAGVGRHANRVKCAMLGWTAFEDALLQTEAAASGRGDRREGRNSEGDTQ